MDIFLQFLLEVIHILELLQIQQFGLHDTKEVLHHSIVKTVAFA
jgi:hypothetical protein